MPTEQQSVCCSAPGKVLITGGYLVLERPNSGIVLTLSARFYTTIKPLAQSARVAEPHKIYISSPQFASSFEYHVRNEGGAYSLVPCNSAQKENKYVERAILYALLAGIGIVGSSKISSLLERGLFIEIVGDNDFYSQTDQLKVRNLSRNSASLKSLPRFLKVGDSLQNIAKTGLGSSAALVTSLTAAILTYFEVVDLDSDVGRDIVHNLAQISHCAAQGKIGSGFDISSATYGSQVYTRFSPSVLSDLLKKCEEGAPSPTDITTASKGIWDNQVLPFSLPTGMSLLLGDVNVGANTPVMVKKVLSWKDAATSEALSVWNSLASANSKVEAQFKSLQQLAQNYSAEYEKALNLCAHVEAEKWTEYGEVGSALHELRTTFLQVRSYLRKMGELADVPLEPPPQTKLADATMDLKGVLFAGVPGAGGFDAMFAIVLAPNIIQDVENLWITWSEMDVCPLILHEDKNGVCTEKNI